MKNNYGEMIYCLRKENSLTQEKLGEILGINGKSVSKWERGITIPSLKNIKKICFIFNITVDDFFKQINE